MNKNKKNMNSIAKIALIAVGLICLIGLIFMYFMSKQQKPSVLTKMKSEKIIFENTKDTQKTKDGIKITTQGTLRMEHIGDMPETSSTEFTFEFNGKKKDITFSYPDIVYEWEGHIFTLVNEFPVTLEVVKK